MVKVEQYNFDNPNTRRNKIAYKVDNPDFYESSLSEYNELLEKSKEYVCWFLCTFIVNEIIICYIHNPLMKKSMSKCYYLDL